MYLLARRQTYGWHLSVSTFLPGGGVGSTIEEVQAFHTNDRDEIIRSAYAWMVGYCSAKGWRVLVWRTIDDEDAIPQEQAPDGAAAIFRIQQ